MTYAIEFDKVSKSFNTWNERPHSLKSMLADLTLLRFKKWEKTKREVLSDVSLSIAPGEFVGIMGRNGVGKSTLLKLVSGIYEPSAGLITSRGTIAPLLELGAGFASELTGHENIFLNASILGFSRQLVNERLDSIIEFSELGPAIQKPVRNYSSGMLVRLGFAIAAHLNADILLFDEILAVGDIGFQQKCLRKINELHGRGKTIVLVTHDPSQVNQNCTRCIVVEKTGVVYDGSPVGGTDVYTHLFD